MRKGKENFAVLKVPPKQLLLTLPVNVIGKVKCKRVKLSL
jgi:hypothetical protein